MNEPVVGNHDSDARALSMPIGEAMFTQRSIRRMRKDPIPVERLRVLVAAAAKAPNGGNRQICRLLVTTDRDKIAAFGELYHRSWWAKRKEDRGWNGPPDGRDDPLEPVGRRGAVGVIPARSAPTPR